MKEQEIAKDHVHVCPICREGHVNNNEYMHICRVCFREHEVDLAFVSVIRNHESELVDALEEGGNRILEDLNRQQTKYVRRMTRINKVSNWWFRINMLLVAYWLGVTIGDMIFGS